MILTIYITMLPLILAGIFNMVFTKTSVYKKYKYPIDNKKNWVDGKRIFGDNKTFIGFISMVLFCIIFQVLWGYLNNVFGLTSRNDLYNIHQNTLVLNLVFGFLIGFAYMLFELPNSFVKRRLDITPGKTEKGSKGVFFIIDQIDSLIGVFLVLKIFSDISWLVYFEYILVGFFTHILINLVLFGLKIRKNI